MNALTGKPIVSHTFTPGFGKLLTLDDCFRQPPVHFQNGDKIGINCQLHCDIQHIPKEKLQLERNINGTYEQPNSSLF